MERKTKKTIKKWIGGCSFVLVSLLLAVLPMLAGSGAETHKASILTGTVETGSLQRTLAAGGSLDAPGKTQVTVPEGITLTEFLVENGDVVSEGDPIAKADKVSVMSAVLLVQQTMDDLTRQLQTLSAKIHPGVITADTEGNLYSGGKPVEPSKLSDYASYVTLAQQHREYSQLLADLFRIHQEGVITAPASGMVSGLNRTMLLSGTGEEPILHLLALNTPEGDDELEYTGFVGIVNSVTPENWNMLMNPTPYLLEDLLNVDVDTAFTSMTMTGTHGVEPVLEYDEEWKTVEEIKSGDILLFTYQDGQPVWILKLGTAEGMQTTQPGGQHSGSGFPNISIDWSQFAGYNGIRGGNTATEEEHYTIAENTLCTLVPQERMELTFPVDEQDIGSVAVGMTAAVELDALPGQVLEGTVTQISKFGSSNGGNSKFNVILELPWQAGMLPGMNGSVKLVLEELQEIPLIPVAALVDEGSRMVVYTGYDPKNEVLLNPVPVEIGASDGINAQILSGLPAGMMYWYSYYDTLEISLDAK